MANDPQPQPLLNAAALALTALSATHPPPAFVEAAILPDQLGRFPTHDQLLRALREEAQRRLQPQAPVEYYDDCGGEFSATPPPLPKPPDLTHLRVQTKNAPNGKWLVYVVDLYRDPDCYW